jgi:hypothetical protein
MTENPIEPKYTTRMHMCLSVRGALWNRNWGGLLNDEGKQMSAREAFNALCDELKKGHEVIPVTDCDDFDYTTGCRGHRITIPAEELEARASADHEKRAAPCPRCKGTGDDQAGKCDDCAATGTVMR